MLEQRCFSTSFWGRRRRLLVVALLVVATVSAVVEGHTAFQQSPTVGGSMSDFDPSAAWGTLQIVADDFIFSEPVVMTGVRWWGIYAQGMNFEQVPFSAIVTPSNFTVRIFSSNDGLPDVKLYEADQIGNADRTEKIIGGEVYEYHYDLPTPFMPEPDTPYWLSIIDDTSSFPGDIVFMWRGSASPHWVRTNHPSGERSWILYAGAGGSAFELLEICGYVVAGDLDNNCKVDLADFARMAANWLTVCLDDPVGPECVPKAD